MTRKKLKDRTKEELLEHVKLQENLSFSMGLLIDSLAERLGIEEPEFSYFSDDEHGFQVSVSWGELPCVLDGCDALNLLLGAAVGKKRETEEPTQ